MSKLGAIRDVLLNRVMIGTFELRATLRTADGEVRDLGVLSRRKVTLAFVQKLVDLLAGGSLGDFNAFKYHATGTGSGAESSSDTALGAQHSTRVVGTQVTGNPGGNIRTYTTQATIAYTSSVTIREHGVFSDAVAGTLLDRSLFSAISVTSGDEITYTYTLSVMAEA